MGKKHMTTVTHLEMRRERQLDVPRPLGHFALMRVHNAPLHFYRYLYETVGRDYMWVNRRQLDDEALSTIIHDANVEIYVLYRDGAPIGFAELDFRAMPTVELVFLGLIAETIGLGLGRYLLSEVVRIAWQKAPERVIVQTCTLDHPRALALYQRCGFVPIGQEVVELEEI